MSNYLQLVTIPAIYLLLLSWTKTKRSSSKITQTKTKQLYRKRCIYRRERCSNYSIYSRHQQ